MIDLVAGSTIVDAWNASLADNVVAPDDRYQLIAEVISAVVCAWYDEWATTDPTRQNEAAAALGSARDWNILTEIADQGGWANAIWGYTDAFSGIDSPVESAPDYIDGGEIAIAGTQHVSLRSSEQSDQIVIVRIDHDPERLSHDGPSAVCGPERCQFLGCDQLGLALRQGIGRRYVLTSELVEQPAQVRADHETLHRPSRAEPARDPEPSNRYYVRRYRAVALSSWQAG